MVLYINNSLKIKTTQHYNDGKISVIFLDKLFLYIDIFYLNINIYIGRVVF